MPTTTSSLYEGVARNRRCNALWVSAVTAIRAYAEQTGHTYPPLRILVLPDGRDMHHWCGNVRRRHHERRLLPEQIADLESVPGWQWRRRRPRTNRRPGSAWWRQGITELSDWMRAGSEPPALTAVTDTGYALGAFVDRALAHHAAGALDSEDAARIEALPGWVWHVKRAVRATAITEPSGRGAARRRVADPAAPR